MYQDPQNPKKCLKINIFFRGLQLEQWWGNFGRGKKVTNFSRNCSLRTFKYDLSKKNMFQDPQNPKSWFKN